MILGFSVNTKEAEYPDQKPSRPFSLRIWAAIVETLGDGEDFVPDDLADIILAVCLRVTMFAIGVVKNLEHAPAMAPTASSSKTGRFVAFGPCF